MAKDSGDCEFWLPPQFLTDDDILMNLKACNMRSKSLTRDFGVCFPADIPGGFGPCSGLSSPVESLVSSTETESDEEDYIAGLTRTMAHSTLQDKHWKADSGFGYESQKSLPMAGSPQSTLCGVMGGKQGLSCGSPNCPSRVSSPPAGAADFRRDAAWDLLCAAAGEVARMRMIEENSLCFQNRGLLVPPRKPSPVSAPLKNPNPHSGFLADQSLSYQQLQVAQFKQLKHQQMMRQQGSAVWGQTKQASAAPAAGWPCELNQTHQMIQSKGRNNGRPVGLSPSVWPTPQQSQQQQQQQQASSGMRAVFLGNSGAKKECAGTGVFLPRPIGSQTETRKKPGCSTVLLPDRVVQALNLKLDAIETKPQLRSRHNGLFTPENAGDASNYRRNVLMAQQNGGVRSQPVMNQDLVRLPPEWTY